MFHKSIIIAAAAVFGSAFAGSALAVSNPSFEDGKFGQWQTNGQVGLFGKFKKSFKPSHSLNQAIAFTNRFSDQPKNAATNALAANNFFGVDLAAELGGTLFDGSGIKQTFTLAQAATLTFDWAFAQRTTEASGNDVAFAVLDGMLYTLTDLASAIFTSTGKNDYRFTDHHTFTSLPALAAGEHTLAFGIVNVGSDTGRTALLLDNVTLNPQIVVIDDIPDAPEGNAPPTATPEPVTAALALMGLGAAGYATRRRRLA